MVAARRSNAVDSATDVLIIGSGGSGLPAAVTAAEAGAKVVVLDKRKMLGGTARLPGGVFALETEAQKRQGIRHPTVDEYFRIHMDYGNWMGEALLVRNWLNGTADIIRWLEGKGIEFVAERGLSGPMIVLHRAVGQTVNTGNVIVNTLIKEAKERGVQFLAETRAKRLITDKNGSVTGVLADQKGKELKIKTKSVMIATGSMTRNKDVQKRYFPYIDFDSMPIMQLPYCTGDGYIMAMEAGAAQDGHVSPLWIGPCTHPHNTRIGNVVRRPHGMWVNKLGMRYCDETLWSLRDYGWWVGMALDRQPGRICYALMDDKILKDMIKNKEIVNGMEEIYGRITGKSINDVKKATDRESGIVANEEADPTAWLDELPEDIKSEEKAGRIKISDSWDEIAKWIGAEPAVLKAQVDRYNTFCKNGYDADFLKPKEWLLPLKTPPYYAMKAHQGLDLFSGGIRVNHRMEVMSKEELRPISGLYAGGVACSGWFGAAAEATGSCAISFSLYSGYVAGKNAAAYAKSSGK
jgi:fumarate reductase flavoprotein subunit